MKIPSKMLAAAQHACAKNDIRYYLSGIRISRKFVEATNGHVAIRMQHGARVRKDMVVSLHGKISAKAHITKFVFSKDGGTHGDARSYAKSGELVQVLNFTVLDGHYPPLDKVFTGDFDNKNSLPPLNGDYMALPQNMFKGEKFVCAKAMPQDSHTKPVKFIFDGMVNENFGNPELLIMPARWSEQ